MHLFALATISLNWPVIVPPLVNLKSKIQMCHFLKILLAYPHRFFSIIFLPIKS